MYQSLFNIFSTRPGERLFLPEFGFDLEDELFELIDDITTFDIYRMVVDVVARWESRVLIDNSVTRITPNYDQNSYDLVLAFAIQGLEGQTFTFITSFSK